jgi:phenylacetate-CoA ligase
MRAKLELWPGQIDRELAELLVDSQIIRFYERQPHQTVRDFQARQIMNLLSHASEHSEWWRERLGRGQTNGNIDFDAIPIMSRIEYRESIETQRGPLVLPTEQGSSFKNTTSGSSGVALEFFYSALSGRINRNHYHADSIRQNLDPGRLRVHFSIKLKEHAGDSVRGASNPILGTVPKLSRRAQQFTLQQHARWLAEVRPAYIIAHPTLLSGILEVYEEGRVAPPSVDKLLTFAETVAPEFRKRAKAVLGSRVVDRYSCEEIGPLAFQCPQSDGHYHIASTNTFLELLDDSGQACAPGTVGRVIVTGLHNYASPVVRYELGDLASWHPECVCGHSHPVLTNLLGRKRFLVRLPSGDRKYVAFNARDWLPIAPFREFRIIQVTEGVIHAEFVLDRPITIEEHEMALSKLRRDISPDLTYKVIQAEQINWGPGYKRQDVVSLV